MNIVLCIIIIIIHWVAVTCYGKW